MATGKRPRGTRRERSQPLPHDCDAAPPAVAPGPSLGVSVHDSQAFFASAIHDLKAPLTGIALWVDTLGVLQTQLSATEAAQTVALLGQTVEQLQILVRRSIHLVDDVIDILRMEGASGRPSSFTPGEVDLVGLVREALNGWQADRKHLLRLESAESELWGWWDANRLARLVDNLLDNAIKYSPAGGAITVRVGLEDADDRQWALLEVGDQGIGIPAAELPHIFEPFHRAHNVTGAVGGIGLGLWGCRAVVEQHGGTLSVMSREGDGTTFTVRLPLHP